MISSTLCSGPLPVTSSAGGRAAPGALATSPTSPTLVLVGAGGLPLDPGSAASSAALPLRPCAGLGVAAAAGIAAGLGALLTPNWKMPAPASPSSLGGTVRCASSGRCLGASPLLPPFPFPAPLVTAGSAMPLQCTGPHSAFPWAGCALPLPWRWVKPRPRHHRWTPLESLRSLSRPTQTLLAGNLSPAVGTVDLKLRTTDALPERS